MAKRILLINSKRITLILLGLICTIPPIHTAPFQMEQQLSQIEFNLELRKAYIQNDIQLAGTLIRNNRLLVKPFVNDLISESIQKELNSRHRESEADKLIAEKTADSFKNIFGEKSLEIGVGYLKSWTKEQKEKKLTADSLFVIGTKLRGNSQARDKVIGYYQQAASIYREIGDERGDAEIAGSLGLLYYLNMDYQKSLWCYQQALVKREKVDDRHLVGNTLNSIGTIYYSFLQDYQEAIDYFEKAELVRTEIGDLVNLGRTIIVKASAYERLGLYEQSLENYLRSYELNQKSGDQLRMAQAMLNSGGILNDMGKYPEALDNLQKALEINTNINDSIGIGLVFNQMGFVYSNLGDYNTAVDKISEAATIMKDMNDMWELAGVYNNMGIVLQLAGRTEKALEYYNSAVNIYQEQGELSQVLPIMNNIGTLFFDLKDYPKAEEYHNKAIEIARELKDKDQEVRCLLNLANDQSLLGRLDDAMTNYELANEIAKSFNSPELNWKIIAGMAENSELKGDFEKAVELNDSVLKIIDDIRSSLQDGDLKAFYMARERYVFEDIINLLGILHEADNTKGYDRLAFSYAEQCKSRVLLDLLSESFTSNKSIGIENSSNTQYYTEIVGLNEFQALCTDDNTVILEYSVGDSSSCLWVVTQTNKQFFKIPGRKKLQEQVETIRFALQNQDQSTVDYLTETGYSLYVELIKPAEPYISKRSRLVIIPDGILHYLPFEVLLTDNKKNRSGAGYSELPYLVKKYPVSYVQSGSVLKRLLKLQADNMKQGSVSSGKRLIAFGDPVYDETVDSSSEKIQRFNRLEFSGREVESIASLFQDGAVEAFYRKDATEGNLKGNSSLKRFDYIHFATHGIVNESNPDLSSLVLTHDDKSEDDGLLQASEIFNLNLNADLVVLSACQTGLGKLVRGEGMVGLTRAFMYAGTPTVMVSLWSVSDVSTATLMEQFYKCLVKEKLDKTDSLRKAQLSLLKTEEFAHPFYWAPFVIVGDWR